MSEANLERPRSTAGFTTTEGFLARFVAPLLGGGEVEVEAPLSAHDRAHMLEDASPLLDSDFLHLRERVAQRLVADPALPQPGADELSLWLGLHDVLALDHPDNERVWTRASTWNRVETETRSLLAFARPVDMQEALARHLAVGSFLDLVRQDHVVTGPEGELRYRGQVPARRRFNVFSAGFEDVRVEEVRWIDQPHAGIVDRLLPDVMWVSPLTSLLRPRWAPPGWTPLMAVEFLQARAYARTVCHAWARSREWLRIGGVVAGSLLRSLDLHADVFGAVSIAAVPGGAEAMRRAVETRALEDAPFEQDPFDDEEAGAFPALPAPAIPTEPEDIGAVVGALIHLHVLKVLEFDARISVGLGARDWAVQTFLALPLLLPALSSVLGNPFGADAGSAPLGNGSRASRRVTKPALGGQRTRLGSPSPADEGFARRWEEYTEHLAGLVPRNVVDNLHATLVRRIRE